jgi:DNA-binding transcriptional ArsR family regulator
VVDNSEDAFVQALRSLHLRLRSAPAGATPADLILHVDGHEFPLELKPYALVDMPRASQIRQLQASSKTPVGKPMLVVVGDRIVEGARDQLREAGISWFDLRGHLYLNGPGLRIDVPTPRFTEHAFSSQPLTGRVGLGTAIDLLLNRPRHTAVRETARRIKASPSTVSSALKALRAEGLIDDGGTPDLKALFWATARRWRPDWVAVARYPHPDGPMRNPALELGFDDPHKPGWSLTGDLAAAHLGAPIGVSSAAPPDFYVPSRQAHRLAVSILDQARPGSSPAARLAVPPVLAACEERIDISTSVDEHWLLARPLFVALGLAQDPGRGVEIIDAWTPSDEGTRVW